MKFGSKKENMNKIYITEIIFKKKKVISFQNGGQNIFFNIAQ